jgi:hypothetical protein
LRVRFGTGVICEGCLNFLLLSPPQCKGQGRFCSSKGTMPRKNQALSLAAVLRRLAGILLMGCFAAHAFVGAPVQNHCRKSVASCHRPASHLQRHPPSVPVPRILSFLGRDCYLPGVTAEKSLRRRCRCRSSGSSGSTNPPCLLQFNFKTNFNTHHRSHRSLL